jgi:peptidoglycan/xylan/chitin deacetylase (PgdA/CDA1 family)
VSGRALRWLVSLVRRRPNAAGARLTIVRHHRVYAEDERPLHRLGVSEGVFRAQLELLSAAGLRPVTITEGMERLARGTPGHHVAMSFDDGYADNVGRALPLLTAVGGRATFFLTAGLIERRVAPWWDELAFMLERTSHRQFPWPPGSGTMLRLDDRPARRHALTTLVAAMSAPPEQQAAVLAGLRTALAVETAAPCELATWEECRTLATAGMEIGAHTLTHPYLTRLDRHRQEEEIAGSLDLIEARLGARPRGFAYPGGAYDAAGIAACEAARLAWAVTTRAGDNAPDAPRFELRRRGWSDGACLGPGGQFSRRLALAEIEGAFDRLRGLEAAS